MINYCAECVVSKDLDPNQAAANAQMVAMGNGLQRIPQGDGAWRVAGPFWQMAELFKRQMEEVYAKFEATGVSAMDPDDPPPGVALRMEYSTFCQGFLPHLSSDEGEKLLAMFGLTGDYTEVPDQPTESHNCGGCGAALTTVVGARVVVCESCGRRVDIAAGSIPCHNCGAQLDFPEGESHLACPYCQTQNQRV
jgi:LSD1 subclass zinc finger protein